MTLSLEKSLNEVELKRLLPKVRTSKLTMEEFDPRKIAESLVREAGLDRRTAEEVAAEVMELVIRAKLRFLSAPLIRELVNYALLERGLEEARKRYTRVGMPVYDVDRLLDTGINENANLMVNPESIHKWAADRLFIEHALLTMPEHIADAHMSGLIHIHDLEYWSVGRPFCLSHDPRFVLTHGLLIDGTGLHSAVAGPAKHWEVAVCHMCEWLGAMQVHCAGGQGLEYFNIFLAPFLAGRPYREYKQAAQMFIYNMEQMYVARGGQTVFSSIAVQPDVPDFVAELPAVLPGGKVSESLTYGDFAEEARLFFRAIVQVYYEGDWRGKPFNFPKLEVKLTEEGLKKSEDEYLLVSKLAAKFGTPYFLNQIPDYMPKISHSQCCRLIFGAENDERDMEDFYEGRVRMSCLHYTTINLPRIAYEARGDDDRLFDILAERLELAKESLLVRREIVGKALKNGRLPLLTMDVGNGDIYYPFDRAWHNIGFVGLNEMLKAHTGFELHEDRDAWRFGLRVVKFMTDACNEFAEETGLRWALLQTPAESCAHRLALIDLREFGDKAVVQGDRRTGAVYYTNSSHVRPSADLPLMKRLLVEGSFHPLTTGGAIAHVWLGERRPDPKALWELTRRIALKTNISYFAHTLDYTVCPRCWAVEAGIRERCPRCGYEGVEWYSRVTGYYSRVSRWNAGKKAELLDRRRYYIA
ncbi:MAG TPA: anaerobic ribonucleoside-triphosphate reductase [Candidatus Bathyarchaeota archaeon]|nr:anaerobic ribonucleoside-triphosphate reductase [Candidatus Bathyarchaeota archaeon]